MSSAQPPQKTTLLTLPSEVWTSIFRSLPAFSSVVSLRRTCRALNAHYHHNRTAIIDAVMRTYLGPNLPFAMEILRGQNGGMTMLAIDTMCFWADGRGLIPSLAARYLVQNHRIVMKYVKASVEDGWYRKYMCALLDAADVDTDVDTDAKVEEDGEDGEDEEEALTYIIYEAFADGLQFTYRPSRRVLEPGKQASEDAEDTRTSWKEHRRCLLERALWASMFETARDGRERYYTVGMCEMCTGYGTCSIRCFKKGVHHIERWFLEKMGAGET